MVLKLSLSTVHGVQFGTWKNQQAKRTQEVIKTLRDLKSHSENWESLLPRNVELRMLRSVLGEKECRQRWWK